MTLLFEDPLFTFGIIFNSNVFNSIHFFNKLNKSTLINYYFNAWTKIEGGEGTNVPKIY
jgi:hypothetical protein